MAHAGYGYGGAPPVSVVSIIHICTAWRKYFTTR